MENYLIARRTPSGELVRVRQKQIGDTVFVCDDGREFKIYELDLTEARFDFGTLPPMPETPDMQDFNEKNADMMKRLDNMLNAMDVEKQDDHRAEIADREYWRKLRGDMFLQLIRQWCCYDKSALTSITEDVDFVVKRLRQEHKNMLDETA